MHQKTPGETPLKHAKSCWRPHGSTICTCCIARENIWKIMPISDKKQPQETTKLEENTRVRQKVLDWVPRVKQRPPAWAPREGLHRTRGRGYHYAPLVSCPGIYIYIYIYIYSSLSLSLHLVFCLSCASLLIKKTPPNWDRAGFIGRPFTKHVAISNTDKANWSWIGGLGGGGSNTLYTLQTLYILYTSYI